MSNNEPIVIYGSARSEGNTMIAVEEVLGGREASIVDLNDLDIGNFDYDFANNEGDDFIPLIERILKHDKIIIATPVYWYTMSAVMKTFFDRWSDILGPHKELGKALANKWMYVVTSYGGDFPIGFEGLFRLICQYMKMHYGGCYFHYSGNDPIRMTENAPLARNFRHLLWEK